jgi:hypothetical protein
MFIPDTLEKKVQIPVSIVDGQVVSFYGGPLPALREGTMGELVVPVYSVSDRKWLEVLDGQTKQVIAGVGEALWVQVNVPALSKIDEKLKKHLVADERPLQLVAGRYQVKILLLADLVLRQPGTKRALLLPCDCEIPALDGVASSLNEAYTRISQAYEVQRRGHTGNVFHKVFCTEWFDGREWLVSLDTKRNRMEAEYEKELVKVWYGDDPQAMERFQEDLRQRSLFEMEG